MTIPHQLLKMKRRRGGKKNPVAESYEDDQGEGHSLGMIKRLAASFTLFFFSFFFVAEWRDLLLCVLYVRMTSTCIRLREINKQVRDIK